MEACWGNKRLRKDEQNPYGDQVHTGRHKTRKNIWREMGIKGIGGSGSVPRGGVSSE